jgi:hypothetical protein
MKVILDINNVEMYYQQYIGSGGKKFDLHKQIIRSLILTYTYENNWVGRRRTY